MLGTTDWRDVLLFLGIAVIGYVVISLMFRSKKQPRTASVRLCSNQSCGSANPPTASFCKQCGRELYDSA